MSELSQTTQERISLLSLINSAVQVSEDMDSAVAQARDVLDYMKAQGFFGDSGNVVSSTPSEPSTPQSSAKETSSEACPDCAEEGRDGMKVKNTGDTGPAAECSLRVRKKFGSKYRDVGECDWKDWGDRYKDN